VRRHLPIRSRAPSSRRRRRLRRARQVAGFPPGPAMPHPREATRRVAHALPLLRATRMATMPRPRRLSTRSRPRRRAWARRCIAHRPARPSPCGSRATPASARLSAAIAPFRVRYRQALRLAVPVHSRAGRTGRGVHRADRDHHPSSAADPAAADLRQHGEPGGHHLPGRPDLPEQLPKAPRAGWWSLRCSSRTWCSSASSSSTSWPCSSRVSRS
jgi:hypothetical protein